MENLKIVQLLKDKEVKKIIRKLHIDIYRTFNKVLLIFKKYNIRYTLAHGTLLGQVRNNNLLLWDDDIDFVIENDKIFENKDFLKDCYDIGLAVIITPYELGYSALYRMTDHKYLNEQPNIKPSLGGPNYNYPKLIVDVHDVSHYRKKPFNIDFINFDNVELCNMGPLNVVKIKNYMPLIKKFININNVDEVVITHIHNNGLASNFLLKYIKKNELPYKLNQKEIQAITDYYNSDEYRITIDDIKI